MQQPVGWLESIYLHGRNELYETPLVSGVGNIRFVPRWMHPTQFLQRAHHLVRTNYPDNDHRHDDIEESWSGGWVFRVCSPRDGRDLGG